MYSSKLKFNKYKSLTNANKLKTNKGLAPE